MVQAKSVAEARRKAAEKNNKYIQKYGSLLWSSAVLTAYQHGGFKELIDNYRNVPLQYQELLMDAYEYIGYKTELSIAQAAARPYMEKKDGKKYMENLASKLEGRQ